MKLRLIGILLILSSLSFSQELNYIDDPDHVSAIIYNVARHYKNTIAESIQYVDSIRKAAEEYNINPILLLRQGATESWLNRYAIAHVPGEGAYGWAQIIPKYWGWVLPYVVTNYEPRNYYRYFFDIDTSAKMLGYIMSHMLRESQGDYPLALVAYNFGPNSWWFRVYYRNNYNRLKNLKYWKMIFDDVYFLWDAGMTREQILDRTPWHQEVIFPRADYVPPYCPASKP